MKTGNDLRWQADIFAAKSDLRHTDRIFRAICRIQIARMVKTVIFPMTYGLVDLIKIEMLLMKITLNKIRGNTYKIKDGLKNCF